MATLLDLPPELLLEIYNLAGPENYPAFRLCSRVVAQLGQKQFIAAFFTNRAYFMSKKSLKRFYAVLDHPVFREHISTVVFAAAERKEGSEWAELFHMLQCAFEKVSELELEISIGVHHSTRIGPGTWGFVVAWTQKSSELARDVAAAAIRGDLRVNEILLDVEMEKGDYLCVSRGEADHFVSETVEHVAWCEMTKHLPITARFTTGTEEPGATSSSRLTWFPDQRQFQAQHLSLEQFNKFGHVGYVLEEINIEDCDMFGEDLRALMDESIRSLTLTNIRLFWWSDESDMKNREPIWGSWVRAIQNMLHRRFTYCHLSQLWAGPVEEGVLEVPAGDEELEAEGVDDVHQALGDLCQQLIAARVSRMGANV